MQNRIKEIMETIRQIYPDSSTKVILCDATNYNASDSPRHLRYRLHDQINGYKRARIKYEIINKAQQLDIHIVEEV